MLKAIIIDDEENSLGALKEKVKKHCPSIDIIATCSSPAEGIEKINSLKPGLVFLDIEMPGMNGFNLLSNVTYKNFETIFVTAYDHYAIKAIRSSAFDYLLKPVDIDELKDAVDRIDLKINSNSTDERLEILLEQLAHPKKELKRLAISTNEGLRFVKTSDIVYLEASVNYTYIHLANKEKHIISRTIKVFEEMLPADTFIRIHNSYIINRDHLEKYIRGEGGHVVLSSGAVLDVAKRKKADFLQAIGY
ncbi:MAG: LytTR family DNA-binding domain-containing protein [Sediminibacterium sp.]